MSYEGKHEQREVQSGDQKNYQTLAGKQKKAKRKIGSESGDKVEAVNKKDTANKKVNIGQTEKLNKHFFNSIGFRFIIAFTIPIVFMICIGILSYRQASDAIITSFKDNGYQSILMTDDYSSFGLDSVEATAFQYVVDESYQKYFSNFYITEASTEADILAAMKSLIFAKQLSDEFISDIHFISKNKDMVSTSELSTTDYESVYQSFLETEEGANLAEDSKGGYWFGNSDMLNAISDNKDVAIRYCKGFQAGKGCVIIDVSKERIISILSQLDFGENSLIGFITSDGKEIITSAGAEVEDSNALLTGTDFYQQARNNIEETSGTMDVEYNGEAQLFVYSILEDSQVMICALVPEANMISRVQGIKLLTILTVLISIIVVAIIGSIMTLDLQKVIRYMNNKFYEVAEGNLTVQMKSKRKDEFLSLLKGTNHMIERMKELIMQVKAHMDLVVGSAENVNKASNEFLQSSETIKISIDEIQIGIREQASDSVACFNSLDVLSGKIDLINGEATNINRIAKSTMQSIDHGKNAIHVLEEKAKATAKVTSKMKESINVLEDKSNMISSISSTINSIAEETNLLSLNASIEAARAGIYGKGFSVIADEIRKLADQSASSVNEISNLVHEIQQQIGSTAKVVGEVEHIVQEQEGSVRETEDSFDTMNTQVNQFVETINSILGKIAEVQKSKVEAMSAMEHISAVSQQTESSSYEITEITNKQLEDVKELGMLSKKLDRDARELMEVTERFIVEEKENN